MGNRYDFLCHDCGVVHRDFFYRMAHIGTDAVRCGWCGSPNVTQLFDQTRVSIRTDTNFQGFWDYASAPGARYIGTRMEYKDLVATRRAKGIQVGGDYAGKRNGVVERMHDKIDQYGPGEARRQREAWQRDHEHIIHPKGGDGESS